MIRRTLLALVALPLGIASLLLADFLMQWTRAHLGWFPLHTSGECFDVGMCRPGFWQGAEIVLFYLGPVLTFAGCAFVFSRTRRAPSQWLALVGGLVAVHQVVVFAVVS